MAENVTNRTNVYVKFSYFIRPSKRILNTILQFVSPKEISVQAKLNAFKTRYREFLLNFTVGPTINVI